MRSSLAAWTFSHFCVDFACFWFLFARAMTAELPLQTAAFVFLAYNILAFGLQPAIGYLIDAHPKIPAGLIGCGAVAAGVMTSTLLIPALLLLAVGNAFFHIGGGIDSLSGGGMTRSGVFVSTGALGVALGTLAGRAGQPLWLPLALLLLSALLIVALVPRPRAAPEKPRAFWGGVADVASSLPFAALLLLVGLSVVVRSFVGASLVLPWRSASALYGIAPALCAFAGKAAGGILGDRLGARNVGVLGLLLSLPCLALGAAIPLAAMAGLALFNLTMPVTLCALASRLPGRPGLAFGLSTLALLLGSVPTFFFKLPAGALSAVTAGLIAVSAVCVLLSTRNQTGGFIHERSSQHPAA
jgi:FSR family fosmidomycin resistance protein-like MFS transporter